MKLTEQQLAQLFQTASQKNTSTSQASDCLGATAASSDRLKHAENLLNDHTSSQAMKLAMSLRDWSDIMADAMNTSRKSWFSFLGMSSPLKTSVATAAFALALVFALPEFSNFNSQRPMHVPVQSDLVHGDTINSLKFESDQINQGGFDQIKQKSDSLFNTSFG